MVPVRCGTTSRKNTTAASSVPVDAAEHSESAHPRRRGSRCCASGYVCGGPYSLCRHKRQRRTVSNQRGVAAEGRCGWEPPGGPQSPACRGGGASRVR